MSFIESIVSQWEINRDRTLATVKSLGEIDSAAALAWRPGVGRAHIAWQLLHIAITEEVFGTQRLAESDSKFADLLPKYRGGSTPEDGDQPSLDEITNVLAETRQNLLATVSGLSDDDLDKIPPGMAERGWTLRRTLQIITWHEPHHQGQSHITQNLFKNQ